MTYKELFYVFLYSYSLVVTPYAHWRVFIMILHIKLIKMQNK